MMKRRMFKVALGMMVVAAVGTAGTMGVYAEAGSGTSPEVLCPVMGEAVNFAISASTDNGPVFFCCKRCVGKFEGNPDKYADDVVEQRKALAKRERVQTTCPVSGKSVDPKVYVEHQGEKVFLCCNGCAGKFKKNPDKFASALAKSYTYQTHCPVMKEEIDPAVFASTAGGNKIFFCCKGCDKKFFKNPAKYTANLAAQGFEFKPSELVKAGSDGRSGDGHDAHGHEGHGHDGHDHGSHDHEDG